MNKIKDLIDQPAALEKYYRENKNKFIQDFQEAYPDLEGHLVAETWKARLNFQKNTFYWGSVAQIKIVIILSLVGALFAQIPLLLGMEEDVFFQKNIGFLLFSLSPLYLIFTQKIQKKTIGIFGILTAISLAYINLMPFADQSAILELSALHLPVLLAGIYGMVWLQKWKSSLSNKVEMVKFGADLFILTGLLVLSFGVLTGITINLFEAIGWQIGDFWGQYILPSIGPSLPLISTFMLLNNRGLVHKLSPIIAQLLSPLVTIILIGFSLVYWTGNNSAFENRETLIIFNVLLVGVMALLFFSLSHLEYFHKFRKYILVNLLIMSILTMGVDWIALSAIGFRIANYGWTPNRLAVLGTNLIFLFHLGLSIYYLWLGLLGKHQTIPGPQIFVRFLPIIMIWLLFVIFVFPIIFGIH
jgi:hypothetical protein